MNRLTSYTYLLENETVAGDASALFEGLGEELRLSVETPHFWTRTGHDTFDGRLFRSDRCLWSVRRSGDVELTLASVAGEEFERLRCDRPPAFVWDLDAADPSEQKFRRVLEPVIEMRRLLPLVTIRAEETLARVLDRREKTVVKLILLRGFAQVVDREPQPIPALLTVVPVRGYDRQLEKARGLLEGSLGLEAPGRSVLEMALEAVGVDPRGHSSKPVVKLDSSWTAGRAVRSILASLLTVIVRNEDGTRDDLDSEFLHDFRVSVRRARALLGQLKKAMPPEIEGFRRELAWLGRATGPTRDLDVYLLKIPSYATQLPEEVRPDLAPLEEFLRDRQRREQGLLAVALGSERYRRLRAEWAEWARDPVAPDAGVDRSDSGGGLGERPVREVAAQRIWRVYRRILKKGRAIGPETVADALHDVRIEGKKLRYLLEFFRSLFGPEAPPLIRELKKLQDNLGDFNDYEVQRLALEDLAQEMLEEGRASTRTLLAMGRLTDRLEQGQAEERRRFHRKFDQFARPEVVERFRALFAPKRRQS